MHLNIIYLFSFNSMRWSHTEISSNNCFDFFISIINRLYFIIYSVNSITKVTSNHPKFIKKYNSLIRNINQLIWVKKFINNEWQSMAYLLVLASFFFLMLLSKVMTIFYSNFNTFNTIKNSLFEISYILLNGINISSINISVNN